MHDIVPESSRSTTSGMKKESNRSTQKVVYAGPRVVQVEWKLPSRLRKPIREQLAKERQQRKRRTAAAVTFARKPIRTQALLEATPQVPRASNAQVRQPRRFFNRGAEHHTKDIYSQGKPQLRVAAPPYLGRVARKTSDATKSVPRQAPRRRVAPQPARAPRRPNMAQKTRSAMPYAERDMPMEWNKTSVPVQMQESTQEMFAPVAKPKKMLPGITFSLWPKNWFGSKDAGEPVQNGQPVMAASKTSKKKRLIF